MPLAYRHTEMKIAVNMVFFVGAGLKPAWTRQCRVPTRFPQYMPIFTGVTF